MADMGCYEFLNDLADSDGDGLTDRFEKDVVGSSIINVNTDGDVFTDYQEYIADTDPNNPDDLFEIIECDGKTVWFESSADRVYTLFWCTDLTDPYWGAVRGQAQIQGTGDLMSLTDTDDAPSCSYRVTVELP